MDANEYLIQCVPEDPMTAPETEQYGSDHEAAYDAWVNFGNAVADEVDRRIKSGELTRRGKTADDYLVGRTAGQAKARASVDIDATPAVHGTNGFKAGWRVGYADVRAERSGAECA